MVVKRAEPFDALSESLQGLVRSFLLDRTIRVRPKYRDLPPGREPKYVEWAQAMLKVFTEWMSATHGRVLGVADVDRDVIRAFLRHLQVERRKTWRRKERGKWIEESRPLSASTVRGYFNVLRVLFRYGEEEGLCANPMKGLKPPQVPDDLIPSPNDELIQSLLSLPRRKTFTGARNYAILVLFLGSGLRLSELTGLGVEDVDWQNGQVRATRKQRRQQIVPLDDATLRELLRWMKVRARVVEADSGPLFITREGRRLTAWGVQSTFRRWRRKLGVKGQRILSPHSMRHGYARLALRAGMNVIALQDILGHRTLEQTRRYVTLYRPDLLEAQRKASVMAPFLRRGGR